MNRAVRQHSALPVAQRGAVVLMLLVIIAVSTATYFLVHELNNTRLRIEQDKINAAVLAQARDAAWGFALTNQNMPGGLPFPDRAKDGGYNGNGDCVTHNFKDYHLLGKFPFLNEEGCGTDRAFDISPTDANGERLWYAASKNLVKSAGGYFPKPINTSTLMASTEWLTVVDESGTVLSNQVAFVLIAPGGVLPDQNRAGKKPNVSNYLDKFTVGATIYNNANGTDSTSTGFITARPVNDATNHFNDRLLYVTRDEFINRLVLRVAGEIRLRLDQYHMTNYTYPPDLATVLPTPPPPLADWLLDYWAPPVTTYTYFSANQATIKFASCASTFTIKWNSEMLRSGPC